MRYLPYCVEKPPPTEWDCSVSSPDLYIFSFVVPGYLDYMKNKHRYHMSPLAVDSDPGPSRPGGDPPLASTQGLQQASPGPGRYGTHNP